MPLTLPSPRGRGFLRPHPSPLPLAEVGGRRSEAGFFVLTLALFPNLSLSLWERVERSEGEGKWASVLRARVSAAIK